MKNLAGDIKCDSQIAVELQKAGIEIVRHDQPLHQEVPAMLTGQLMSGGTVLFAFTRAWYYWVVKGFVPLRIAIRLYYNDPIGRTDIRVDGNCSCPPPTEDVYTYHIDTQEGLNLFVATIKNWCEVN